jgi:hypothetical protein
VCLATVCVLQSGALCASGPGVVSYDCNYGVVMRQPSLLVPVDLRGGMNASTVNGLSMLLSATMTDKGASAAPGLESLVFGGSARYAGLDRFGGVGASEKECDAMACFPDLDPSLMPVGWGAHVSLSFARCDEDSLCRVG